MNHGERLAVGVLVVEAAGGAPEDGDVDRDERDADADARGVAPRRIRRGEVVGRAGAESEDLACRASNQVQPYRYVTTASCLEKISSIDVVTPSC